MKQLEKNLPNLIKAAFENDKEIIEMSTLSLMRALKKENPEIATKISEILSNYRAGASLTRAYGQDPVPKDEDSANDLVKLEDSSVLPSEIFFSDKQMETIEDFLRKRNNMEKLLEYGIKPANSLLLYGAPGVGKTYLAKYLANQLDIPLLTLDLSSTMSSYLGKTGRNIKEVLDYAKRSPSILLIDEFDAIAKKRTDASELGELKRIVNVLLKELEVWPHDCVLVAATNHVELLDDAIWRRFNIKIEVSKPDEELRMKLWDFYLNIGVVRVDTKFLKFLSSMFKGLTPADIELISSQSLQKQIIYGGDIKKNVLKSFIDVQIDLGNIPKKTLVKTLKKEYGSSLTQREISNLTDVSLTSVNRYLKEGDNK